MVVVVVVVVIVVVVLRLAFCLLVDVVLQICLLLKVVLQFCVFVDVVPHTFSRNLVPHPIRRTISLVESIPTIPPSLETKYCSLAPEAIVDITSQLRGFVESNPTAHQISIQDQSYMRVEIRSSYCFVAPMRDTIKLILLIQVRLKGLLIREFVFIKNARR